MEIGKKLPLEKLQAYLHDFEGEITLRYGKIGQGKTYGATADVLDDLKHGWIVYTTWPIQFDGYDQRDSLFFVLGSLLFPWANTFKVIPKDNLRYINIFDDKFIEEFENLKNCKVYIDEGHIAFDSYEMAKASMQKRASILHTRHFNRSINIISQRPTAIHVAMRANVNRFYKYQKYGKRPPFMFFLRTEYQEMNGETVDETKPESRKFYFPSKSVYMAYNSKYLSGDLTQSIHFDIFKVNIFMRIYLLFRNIFRRKNRRL